MTSPTDRTRIRRLPERAVTDRSSLNAILDAALVAHLAVVDDRQPSMACARDNDRLLLHGSTGSRLMRLLTEHLLPARWDTLRAPKRKEPAATSVLALPLAEWSVRVADGHRHDDPDDLDAPVWAGILPLTLIPGAPVDAPDLRCDHAAGPVVAPAVARLRGG